jgi:hypothetical protein
MMSRLTLRCPAGSEEDNVDCVRVGSQPLCQLVDIILLDVVVFILVHVVDQEDCFSLVINDSVPDECDEVDILNALIRLLADFFNAFYLFFDNEVEVKLLAVIVCEDYWQRPVQLIHQVIFHPGCIFMTHGQILPFTSFL